jgi:hypothetical protein
VRRLICALAGAWLYRASAALYPRQGFHTPSHRADAR